MPALVVIVGPIASGKSTIAAGLAERFRARDRRVALIDLDDLVETIGGFVGLSVEQLRQAQMVFGQLVGAWLAQGFSVRVVAEKGQLQAQPKATLSWWMGH